jgi:hypothetical protein
MQVNTSVVERIIKGRKSKTPIRQLKDILKDKVIKEDAIFRLSVNDFIKMRNNVVLRRMMTKPLNTNLEDLTKFCDIIAVDAKKHIDLSAKNIKEKIHAMNAPLLISDFPDDTIDMIMGQYDSMIYTIFTKLKTFLVYLSKEVEEGHTLIANIVASFSDDDKTDIVNNIRIFFEEQDIKEKQRTKYFNGVSPNTDDFSNLIKTFIRNIYLRSLYPSSINTTFNILFLNIEYFSQVYFFLNTKLQSNIKEQLFSFMTEYTPKLDDRLIEYMSNLIDDVIDEKYVFKLSPDDRNYVDDKLYDKLYNNYYLLIEGIEGRNKMERKGEAVGTGVPTPNKKFVVTKNNFTHEECKMWAMMPIFNPRTLNPILIDSPLYNRLLCLSYQYDRCLIPRMITSRGYKVIYRVLFTKNSQSSSSSPRSGQYM